MKSIIAFLTLPFYALAGTGFAAGDHQGHAGSISSQAYAGQQQRQIKALSAQEMEALRAGAGLGFARAAELNHFPGPMHALELAAPLGLTATQQRDIARLMEQHKAEARALGVEVVRLEAELDALFAGGKPTGDAVRAKTTEIGLAQARYRASHLTTHIETTSMLTADQITRYDRLRGYAGSTAPKGATEGHKHAH